MTAVPKPLKFLRPHYETLVQTYESWPEGEHKTSLADVLSVIGMTNRSCLSRNNANRLLELH